jgi:hypothetical protein
LTRGVSGAEVLERYLSGWSSYGVDLDGMLRVETARMIQFDEQCEVKSADFLLSEFANHRLFFTLNHPAPNLYREILKRTIRACADVDPALDGVDIESTFSEILKTRPRGPLDTMMIPVHPKVAENFDLTWYDPNERYENLRTNQLVSYRDYFAAMISESIKLRATV